MTKVGKRFLKCRRSYTVIKNKRWLHAVTPHVKCKKQAQKEKEKLGQETNLRDAVLQHSFQNKHFFNPLFKFLILLHT